MENILKKIGKISSFASRYIGIIIIAFSCLAFFWRDGFAWMTNYTSVFLGVIMFGMGLTIRLEDFRAIFSRPKEVIIGAVAQYTIMPVVAWVLCKVMNLPADLALGVILVGCCPGGTAYDFYIKIQILDHFADDSQLLSILLSEICSVRGYNMEQLGYNCAHTFEMDRTCFSTKCLR